MDFETYSLTSGGVKDTADKKKNSNFLTDKEVIETVAKTISEAKKEVVKSRATYSEADKEKLRVSPKEPQDKKYRYTNADIEVTIPIITYKDKVIQAIKETSDGRLMETLLEFAEMMDYKEAFCSPILEMDSAFFSAMDEVDHYQMALQKRQIDLLKQIVSLLSGEVIMIPPNSIKNSITDKGRAHWTSEEIKEMQRKGK